MINEREQEMLTQITNIHHMKSKTLELQKNDFQLMLGNLNSSVDFTENVLRHGNEAEVTLVKKQMTQVMIISLLTSTLTRTMTTALTIILTMATTITTTITIAKTMNIKKINDNNSCNNILEI